LEEGISIGRIIEMASEIKSDAVTRELEKVQIPSKLE